VSRDSDDFRTDVLDFFENLAMTWDETTTVVADKIERIVGEADLRPGDAVLDVGSGTGVLLPFLSRAVGPTGRIYELDISPAMLEQARAKGFAEADYLCAPAEDIPLPDACRPAPGGG